MPTKPRVELVIRRLISPPPETGGYTVYEQATIPEVIEWLTTGERIYTAPALMIERLRELGELERLKELDVL